MVPQLRLDAQFTVVEAALKGYMKWRTAHGSKPQQDVSHHPYYSGVGINPCKEQQRVAIENNLETWCERLLDLGSSFEVCIHSMVNGNTALLI
jgi:exportin-5